MAFRFRLRLRDKVIIGGLAGLVLFLAIFLAPSFFAATLDEGKAEEEIRAFLKKEAANRHLSVMQAAGMDSPDAALAERMEADLIKIDRIEFISLEVARFIFTPPTTTSRLFIAKAILRDEGQKPTTRYFSLSVQKKILRFLLGQRAIPMDVDFFCLIVGRFFQSSPHYYISFSGWDLSEEDNSIW